MEKKIKDALGVVIIISLIVVAFSVLRGVNTYSKAIEPSSFRSFSVTGQGKAVSVPDVAQFTFNVITEGGTDVASLQEQNTKKVNEAISYLKDNKVDDEDVTTQSYNINPRYTYFPCTGSGPCRPPSIDGYTINQSVSVKVRNFDAIGELLAGVVNKGANSVSQLRFTLDDPTEAENEARKEAIEKAQEKAKDIARAGGFGLGRLLSIQESGLPTPYPQGFATGFGGGGAEDARAYIVPEIEPGSQETNISVTLIYEIQ